MWCSEVLPLGIYHSTQLLFAYYRHELNETPDKKSAATLYTSFLSAEPVAPHISPRRAEGFEVGLITVMPRPAGFVRRRASHYYYCERSLYEV